MLGKYHIIFNVITFLPFYYYLAILDYNYNLILASLLLLILFSNFPDIDLSNRKTKKYSKILGFIFYSIFIILALMMKKRKAIKHRGITHSLQGLTCFSFIFFIIWLFLLQTDISWLKSLIIPFSAIAAYSLHLIGDMITKEGVDFLMNGNKIKGIIRTGKGDFIFVSLYSISKLSLLFYSIQSMNYSLLLIASPLVFLIAITLPVMLNYKRL